MSSTDDTFTAARTLAALAAVRDAHAANHPNPSVTPWTRPPHAPYGPVRPCSPSFRTAADHPPTMVTSSPCWPTWSQTCGT